MCQIAGVPVLASLAVLGCLIEKFLALLDAVASLVEERHVIAALGIASQQRLVGGLTCTGGFAVVLIASADEGVALDALALAVLHDGAQQAVQGAGVFGQPVRMRNAVKIHFGTVVPDGKEGLGTLKGDGFIATVAASEGCQCRNDDGKNKYLFHERNEELFILLSVFSVEDL